MVFIAPTNGYGLIRETRITVIFWTVKNVMLTLAANFPSLTHRAAANATLPLGFFWLSSSLVTVQLGNLTLIKSDLNVIH